jgi:hypothetical protein
MNDIKQQIVEPILTNPKTQALVASSTVGISAGSSTMESLQNIFGLLGMVLGCVLSAVLIYKNLKELKK